MVVINYIIYIFRIIIIIKCFCCRNLSRSEMNLHKIGGDIKKRIDMYISGLYNNDLLKLNHYKDNFNSQHIRDKDGNNNNNNENEIGHKEPHMKRPHSMNSDLSATRGSTSDSTDSGLGVYGSNVPEAIGLAKKLSNSSSNTYPLDIVSPSMSEMDRRSRLMLRNGSLNDIQFSGQDGMIILPDHDDDDLPGDLPITENGRIINEHEYFEELPSNSSMTPRFCHSCGTKYPNTLAKFCYECGNRRFVAIA